MTQREWPPTTPPSKQKGVLDTHLTTMQGQGCFGLTASHEIASRCIPRRLGARAESRSATEKDIRKYMLAMAAAASLSMSAAEPRIVIAGAGLHGSALAYYLTQRGEKPLVVERHSVAAAASGKGGGFLARDWGSGPTTALHTVVRHSIEFRAPSCHA